MKRLRTICFILFGLPLSAQAVSLFSGNGFGELISPLDAKSKGMGGIAIAPPNGEAWDLNPSLLGSLTETTLSLTLNSELAQHRDGAGEAQTYSFRLSNLRLALPLPRKVVVGASVNKRFDMEFDIIGVPGTADGLEYERSITGRGGIYSTSISLAREIGDYGFLGGTFSFLSGSGIEEWTTEFTNPDIGTSLDSLKHNFSGSSSTFGILTKVGKALSLGFSFTTPARLRGDLVTLSSGLTQSEERTYTVPPSYAVGVAYVLRSRLLIASDLSIYPWRSLTIDGGPSAGFINTYRFALGAELLPTQDELAPLWRRIPLRIGYNNSPWYFKIQGERIEEQFLTLGSSLFLASGVIDLFVEFGERSGGNLRERVLRGGITLSGWEKW